MSRALQQRSFHATPLAHFRRCAPYDWGGKPYSRDIMCLVYLKTSSSTIPPLLRSRNPPRSDSTIPRLDPAFAPHSHLQVARQAGRSSCARTRRFGLRSTPQIRNCTISGHPKHRSVISCSKTLRVLPRLCPVAFLGLPLTLFPCFVPTWTAILLFSWGGTWAARGRLTRKGSTAV